MIGTPPQEYHDDDLSTALILFNPRIDGCSIEELFDRVFGGLEGWIACATGRQARFENPEARCNELIDFGHEFFCYPEQAQGVSNYLQQRARAGLDVYFTPHLFERPGRRLARRALKWIQDLWLDEDEGHYPDTGPEPGIVIHSSATRRQLHWPLSRPIPASEAVLLNRRIATWARADSTKAGLASLLRPPQTFNCKRYPTIDPVVGEITDVAPWDPEVLDQAVPPLPERHKKEREPYNGPPGARIELVSWLGAAGVEVLGEAPDDQGIKFLIVCPWIEEHTGGDRSGTYVGQYPDSALFFRCWHSHCRNREWADFKDKVCPRLGRPSKSKARRVWRVA